MKYKDFALDQKEWDDSQRIARFWYSYPEKHHFQETLKFPSDLSFLSILDTQKEQLLTNLHLALGISYWKAYCPPKATVGSGELTVEQAKFWNMIYREGLGEFYYRNHIDFRSVAPFVADNAKKSSPLSIPQSEKALVLLGGGKDSLTTIALLRKQNIPFDTFSLNFYPIIEKQVAALGLNHISIERTIDKQLFSLPDAYNGHVPISMIYAMAATVIAVLGGYRYIILSNERSANEGNVEYLGQSINHQWSKSMRFEQAFHDYVQQTISPDIEYFSILRPYSELHIAQLFAEAYPKFEVPFTSCNRNFAITKKTDSLWCGECPKCAFVFALFAAYYPKEQLLNLFGKNLFADESLLPLYKELFGVKEIKPFDCVGTPEEVQVAFALTHERGEYAGDSMMNYFVSDILPAMHDIDSMKQELLTPAGEHIIPEHFSHGLPQ